MNQSIEVENAKKIINEFKKKYNKTTDASISKLIFPNEENKRKNFCNYLSKLKSKDYKVASNSANKIVNTISNYGVVDNYSLNDFYHFANNKIGEDTAQFNKNDERFYLIFRNSDIENKILVSYLSIKFENNCLCFKTERNNLGNSERLPFKHIKTNGIGIKNKENSYIFVGFSTSSKTDYIKSFIETFVLHKEPHSNAPFSGYWSGFMSLKNTENPFVGKIIITRIKNIDSIKKIKKETEENNLEKKLGYYFNNEIIKLHNDNDLIKKSNIVNKILKNENIEKYDISNIIANLKMDIKENNDIVTNG